MLTSAIILATPAGAASSIVRVDGADTTSDAAGCGSVANPCNTIQAGIDNAASGDTIHVRAGTYEGAVVDRAVHLKALGQVIIDTGPLSHPPRLRAGFLFNPDRSGSGASIEGFRFVGVPQGIGNPDDGKLDFAIFSRGADDVEVSHNSLSMVLQGITNWNGAGWTIEHNTIIDLWTLNGGGIGILIGGFDGTTVIEDNVLFHNDVNGTIHVDPADSGGYDGVGIVAFADFRSGQPGAPSITENVMEQNRVELVSSSPAVVNANGIELTVAHPGVPPTTISENSVEKNRVKNVSGNAIVVSDGSADNAITKNDFRDSVETDAVDESTGAGTAGTANNWTKNKCGSSSPDGLCDRGR